MKLIHDPDAHLPYAIDWSGWLAAYGYRDTDIQGFEWVSDNPSVEFTRTTQNGAVATAWIRGVPPNATVMITCRIIMPAPGPGATPVTDDYSFYLVGHPK